MLLEYRGEKGNVQINRRRMGSNIYLKVYVKEREITAKNALDVRPMIEII